VVIQDPRIMRFHFPWKFFFRGFFFSIQSSEVVILAKVNCFLVLSFHLFAQFALCLIKLL
jgi:hypothetical protein